MSDFDPDGPVTGDALFGLPFPPEDARVQVVAVPWEATTSYRRGTRRGPAAVLRASGQVDLEDADFGDFWRAGVALLPPDPRIDAWADEVEHDALAVIASGGALPEAAARVDAVAEQVHALVHATARRALVQGRIPAVLGGDHSAPYGLIRAVAETFPGVGILHVDAHADLRVAYQGFRWSHASIMHNALGLEGVGRLVGVGYRDFGRAERERMDSDPRVQPFTDAWLAQRLARGGTLQGVCEQIVTALPDDVYVSLDIDGLDPSLCPHTGTPVPGGLSFRDLQVLLGILAQRKRVVAFDLCEVAPGPVGEWDANVGARVLFKLAGCALRSQEG